MTVEPLPDESEKGKYLIVMSKTPEQDADTGDTFVYCKILNTMIKELKSAEDRYIQHKNDTQVNPNDLTFVQEMKVSEQCKKDIHIVWKTLNPSDTSLLRT
jgi:hypothetical protein